ncbi:MAG TPA: class I SAM-dependent methyltransferase [Ktedonobacterales bacterium]|nr:class I SAM-dependent methyltransferase [Ktedonobacterales bacterium]
MTLTIGKQQQLTPEQWLFVQEACAASAALVAADRLGVLIRLEAGPVDPVVLAHDCAISERGARLLLAALTSLGLIEMTADDSFQPVMPNLVRLSALITRWSTLGAAIRDDRPAAAGNTPLGAETVYPDAVAHLGTWFASVAERAADHLVAGTHCVLDVGIGAAPWSLALAARTPTLRVAAVDLPAVLSVTRQIVATSGYDAQFDYLSGDLFTVDLGHSSYDLAIAGNLCHLFDAAANRHLLMRLFDALRPGGTLAILDALPNERLDGPRPVVLYALGLLLRTNHGQVYPFSTYVSWLREVGYEGIERIDLAPAPPISLIRARRPEAE